MKVAPALKRALKISFSTLLGAGLLYWTSRSWLRVHGEFGEEPHWLEKVAGPVHMLAALFFLVVFGTVWSQHIRTAMKTGKSRVTGWLFVGMVSAMALSGVGLVYIGHEKTLALLGKIHPIIGTTMLPILVIHWKLRSRTSQRLNSA